MKLRYILDYIRATSPRFSDPHSTGLYIENIADASQYLHQYHDLKALQFNFNKIAFQIKSFIAKDFIESWLRNKTIEYLEIKGSNKLTTLPEIIIENPIKYFFIDTDNFLDLSSILPKLTCLEELFLNSKADTIALGKDLCKTINPIKIHIKAVHISDLDQIWNFENLEYLHIEIEDFIKIPSKISNLKKLKYLHIESSYLHKIEFEFDLPYLETLIIKVNKGIENLPSSLFSSSIKELTIKSDNLEHAVLLPENLDLPMIETMEFSGFRIDNFPECIVPQLKKLILGIKASNILCKIKDAKQLTELEIIETLDDDISELKSESISSYYGKIFHKKDRMDFSVWKNLKKLFVKGDEGKNISIIDNNKLEYFRIYHDQAIRSLSDLPESLQEISIFKANNLSQIDLSNKLPNLLHLEIRSCSNLKSIECNNQNFESLGITIIKQCPQFNKMCLPLLLSSNIRYCKLEENNPELYDTHFNSNISKLVPLFKRLKLNEIQKKTLCYWIFKMHRFHEISEQLIENSLNLLKYSHDGIFNLLACYFNKLSKQAKNITDFTLEELKDKKIIILGTPHESRKQIKQKAKDLGLMITTKAEDSDFILLAKKAEISKSYHARLITENDLQKKHDSHFTKILRAETTPQQIKDKLRMMLWSVDPATELTVLEMMKKQGMPQNVIGECIAIAKTSTSTSVRSKYKQFLKPLLAEEELRLMIKNIRFEKIKSNPFDKLRDFSPELLGKFATALYKRTGEYWAELLNYNLTEKEIRQQTIDEKIIPEVEKKPHHIKIYNYLLNTEVDYILEKPLFTKRLNNLLINIKDNELPKSLVKHPYIKKLEIIGDLQNDKLPDVLFELKRLKQLKINSSKLNLIDDRILELTKLEKLFVYNEIPLSLSSRISELKKLTNHFIAVKSS
ncbi:MAG: hypothetical protein N4A49_11570 [Marinifilaceae bacterium]|jgi:hypothetical protein|nr:hypothetical protein [Marinifilaceae bacterium]